MGNRFKATVNKYLLNEMSRWNRGGFHIGDFVHLKPDFKSHQEFKDQPEPVKDQFIKFAEEYDGNLLRVVQVRTSTALPNSPYADKEPINVIDVRFDMGLGGPYTDEVFQMPTCIFDVDEEQLEGRMPKVPEKFYHDAKTTDKPVEFKQELKNDGLVNNLKPTMEKPKRAKS